MNHLITSAYWQQGRNDSALLLQQYRYREIPLCFACLFAGEGEKQGRAGAYLSGRLLSWFRGLTWGRLAKDPERRLRRLGDQLEKVLDRTKKEIKHHGFLTEREEPDFAGILCAGEHFVLFNQGSCEIYLLNRCFDRGHVRRITQKSGLDRENGIFLRQGILQEEIGLLIASESFCSRVTDVEMRECLHVETVRTEEQAARHLRELGSRAEQQGGIHMAALLLLTQAEKPVRGGRP